MIIYYTDKYQGGRQASQRLLQKVISLYTGNEAEAEKLVASLKTGEHGKPYIDGFSCFSISHTGNIWAVLIADRECGLDIQLGRECNYEAVSKRFFDADDSALIADMCSQKDEDVNERAGMADTFFHIWTRREALVKALGRTVYDSDIPAVSQSCVTILGINYSISNLKLADIGNLFAAICVEGDPADVEPMSVDLNGDGGPGKSGSTED